MTGREIIRVNTALQAQSEQRSRERFVTMESAGQALDLQTTCQAEYVINVLGLPGIDIAQRIDSLLTELDESRAVGADRQEKVSIEEWLLLHDADEEIWQKYLRQTEITHAMSTTVAIAQISLLRPDIVADPRVEVALSAGEVYYEKLWEREKADQDAAQSALKCLLDIKLAKHSLDLPDLLERNWKEEFPSVSNDFANKIGAVGLVNAIRSGDQEQIHSWLARCPRDLPFIPDTQGLSYSVAISNDELSRLVRSLPKQSEDGKIPENTVHAVRVLDSLFYAEPDRIRHALEGSPELLTRLLPIETWVTPTEAAHFPGSRYFEFVAALNSGDSRTIKEYLEAGNLKAKVANSEGMLVHALECLSQSGDSATVQTLLHQLISDSLHDVPEDKVANSLKSLGRILAATSAFDPKLTTAVQSDIDLAIQKLAINTEPKMKKPESLLLQKAIAKRGSDIILKGVDTAVIVQKMRKMLEKIDQSAYQKGVELREIFDGSYSSMRAIVSGEKRTAQTDEYLLLFDWGHSSLGSLEQNISSHALRVIAKRNEMLQVRDERYSSLSARLVANRVKNAMVNGSLTSSSTYWAVGIEGQIDVALLERSAAELTLDPLISRYISFMGLKPPFTQESIKTSYFTLSQKYHPDKTNGDYESFIKLNEAYGVLNNMASKGQLDEFDPSLSCWWESLPSRDSVVRSMQARFEAMLQEERESIVTRGIQNRRDRIRRPDDPKLRSEWKPQFTWSEARRSAFGAESSFASSWMANMPESMADGDDPFEALYRAVLSGDEKRLASFVEDEQLTETEVLAFYQRDKARGPGAYGIAWLIKAGMLTLAPLARRGGEQVAFMVPETIGGYATHHSMVAVTGLYHETELGLPEVRIAYGAAGKLLIEYLRLMHFKDRNASVADMVTWQYEQTLEAQAQFLPKIVEELRQEELQRSIHVYA